MKLYEAIKSFKEQHQSTCGSAIVGLEPIRKFFELKRTYETSAVFQDKTIAAEEIAGLLEKLTQNNVPYAQFEHVTGNGITIFYNKLD